ncbi:MAG: ACP S-malonyltransferase [Defluviicoccus sp.]|nr:ACP S-malonyltransferase [Defluviicoccus sp.]MDE0274988.1 ACP S-malonyltransferase [Defluviicoccus sp.]
MTIAFVFPGQGSQAVGMGEALLASFPTARETLEEVDDALSLNLSRLVRDGPAEDLTLTENTQPALMAIGMAVLRVLVRDAGFDFVGRVSRVAGHSLGEYSALAAAGSFSLADAARLLRTRGRAMQEAVPVGEGAMAALLGATLEQARGIAGDAAENQVCDIANDNAPGQVVLSGNSEAVERAVALAKERGIRRAVMLSVSAPFHCRLLRPAAEIMEEALSTVDMNPPEPPLVANVSAETVSDPDEIRELLVAQVTGLVRWRECVLALRAAGVETAVEIGAGKVLTGLARRIDPDLAALSVESPDDIEALLKL